ncbi:MAG TPA: hypothetical protein ENN45_01710, partial [Bacteroidetes bacterium]|nr:hypothetical protein [Bacteroidota bacterium]
MEILDCTIRDGGYITDWNFSNSLVRDIYKVVSMLGLNYFEVGYLDDRKDKNKWARCKKEDIIDATKGVNGTKICAMVDLKNKKNVTLSPAENHPVSMIRVCLNKGQLTEGLKYLKEVKEMGYSNTLQLMGITNYSVSEIRDTINTLNIKDGIDFVSVADSYGSLTPERTYDIIRLFKQNLHPKLKIGFHPHNGLQLAFANTLQAMNAGVDRVDASIYGIGRGAGNLPLELLILHMERENILNGKV